MYRHLGVNFSGKKVVIIGGGKVALRRATDLKKYHAEIKVIAPEVEEAFHEIDVEIIRDTYDRKYLDKSFSVIAATDEKEVNQRVYLDCKELGIPVNMAGGEEKSDIIFPASVFAGDLNISVSTSGKYPVLSKYIRQDLQERYKKFTNEYMSVLEELREFVLAHYRDERQEILEDALELDLENLKILLNKLRNGK